VISMEPVLKRGYTAWDQDVLPADEFAERIANARLEMRTAGLDALVVVNYSLLGAMFEYADIAYLGGLQSGGVLVVLHDEDPTLISFGGGRELFFMREQTWTSNVIPGRGRTFEAARELLGERDIVAGAIGTIGIGGMPRSAAERFNAAFEGYTLSSFDSNLAEIRTRKRPRELMAIGIAKGIVDDAASAAAKVFADGGDNTAAMLEAERHARFHKARDVRVLVNMTPSELRPFEGRLEGRHAPLALWVAAQYHGYWAETAIMSSSQPSIAAACVDAMAAALRAGETAGAVADAGLAALPSSSVDSALQYGLGSTIGLARDEGVQIKPGSNAVIPGGSVVSLVTFATDGASGSIASRMLTVGADGAEELVAVRLA